MNKQKKTPSKFHSMIQNLVAFAGLIAVLGSCALSVNYYQQNLDLIDQSLEQDSITHIPDDFLISLEWGLCLADTPRTYVRISADAQMYVLYLNADQKTGREAYYSLTQKELDQLYRKMIANNIDQLPSQIRSSPDIVVIEPECSQLQYTHDGQISTIDENNGINANYYDIKQAIKQLLENR